MSLQNSSLTVIYGYLAPYAAPVPSAFVLGFSVYHSILGVMGQQFGWLAATVAIVGMVGIESTGGLSAILVSRAVVHKSWSLMWMAIAAVATYAIFVAWGIYSSADSRPMVTTVAITLLAYFVVALWEGMKALESKKSNDTANALQASQARAFELEAEIKKLDAERRLTNSKSRLEKVSNLFSGQVQSFTGQWPTSSEQTGHVEQFDQVVLDKVIDMLKNSPQASTGQIVKAGLGIKSRTTASKYMAKALEEVRK